MVLSVSCEGEEWGRLTPSAAQQDGGGFQTLQGRGVVLSLWRFGVWQVKRFSWWWLAGNLLGSSASDIVVLGSGFTDGGRLC